LNQFHPSRALEKTTNFEQVAWLMNWIYHATGQGRAEREMQNHDLVEHAVADSLIAGVPPYDMAASIGMRSLIDTFDFGAMH
jgi:hypothetical protein